MGHTVGMCNALYDECTEEGILQWQFALFYVSDF